MNSLYHLEKSKLVCTLHPGQTAAHESRRRFVFIIAGTQSGKTSYEPIWLDREIRERGEGDYLAVTATYDLLKLKFLPELQHYFVDLFSWNYSASERTIWKEYKPRMFTRIIMRSADSEGGLESASAKAAVFDECGQDRVGVGAWEAIQRRLSLAQGRVLGGTTPYNLGWLKQQIFDRWRNGDQDYQVIQFKSVMNPCFPRAEYERARATLPEWKFRMFYDGEFTRPAGMIYSDFSDDENTCAPFEMPIHWPRYVGIDFGAVNTALVWLAHDPRTDIYYLYNESLTGGKTTEQHAEEAISHTRAGMSVSYYGGARSETQQRMDWGAAGVTIFEPPVWDVEAGIDRVIAVIKSRRLKVFRNLTGVLDEIGRYSREVDDSGNPTEKIKDKETFHRLDGLRYAVAGLGGMSWVTAEAMEGLGKVENYRSAWR